MRKTVVLIILDGWGRGPKHSSNAIYDANPQTIHYIEKNFPSRSLRASGISVGLPWGEEGNSEVGHLTMGIGRIIYQYYPRISLSIKDGKFFKNEAIGKIMQNVKTRGGKINLIGLVGTANVHSSIEHLNALMKFANNLKIEYALHIFTDGRDSDPKSAFEIISRLPQDKIGSISGRYYAMDRDKRWTLTKSTYDAIVGDANIIKAEDIKKHLQKTYDKNLNDEYIIPVSLTPEKNAVKDGDSLFFFNFREDRIRQISETFVNKNFDKFPIKNFQNLAIASMTKIEEWYNIPVAFPPTKITNSLGSILAKHNLIQLRIAETQKYAHVTFFFNGLRDKPFANEFRILIPSLKITRLENHPEMRAKEITDRLIGAIEGGGFDFILANYANSDMLAHTGNLDATIKAIKIVDEQLARILKTSFTTKNTDIIITADHGNAERLFNPETGAVETKHDNSPVPIYLIGKNYYKPIPETEIELKNQNIVGMLTDIAPTVLDLLNIPKPPEMDGQSLLQQLLI